MKLLEGLEVRSLSDYPSEELTTLLLAISYVKSAMAEDDHLAKGLERWAHRIDLALEEKRQFEQQYK